ncbi:MAG: hypothetical protein D6677_07890 [Calditrichaeota bacterium]|nr:MAG: hypothetical protein D6677_07890 [Calditrichota bacterium]
MARYNFTGEYSCTLDSKRRFNLPSAIRKLIGPEAESTLVFAPGIEENNIYVYPLDEWNKLVARLSKVPMNNHRAQRFIRRFVGGAYQVAIDSQGRLMPPKNLYDKMGIKNEMIILGTINKLEVWDPRTYQAYLDEDKLSLAELVEEINFTDQNHDAAG